MATRARSMSDSTTTRSRSGSTRVTNDHEEIRCWAEERGARAARVPGTDILRLDFPGYTGDDTLEHISWEEFFTILDRNNLALLHQEKTTRGERSNFNKLIDRGTGQATATRRRSQRTQGRTRRSTTQARSRRRSSQSSARGSARGKSSSRRAGSRRAASRRVASIGRRSRGTSARARKSSRARSSSRRSQRRAA